MTRRKAILLPDDIDPERILAFFKGKSHDMTWGARVIELTPCPGNDRTCPGHDHGDPCHYRAYGDSPAMKTREDA